MIRLDRAVCLAFWCPCITFGKVAEMVGRGSPSCGTSGALYGLLMTLTGFQLQSAMSCTYRARLRAHYSLPDAPCCDCCVHYWCGPCALVQEYKELKARGLDPDIGWQHLNLDLDRGGAAPGVQHMGR